ncbi:class I SAM-dependent methyltransferase [Streptomyces sp. NPDC006645]|uniref:class I SAM-dependent methyltransferase n=1 Tax=unclassified Streptomyces TaxID=2593676 RepID=UPI0033BB80CB
MSARTGGAQQELQGDYHRRLFHALHDWERSWAGALDVAGDHSRARALGLDQLGHFGTQGCRLVADAIAEAGPKGAPLVLAELGCGFGGALRDVVDRLSRRDLTVRTAVGLDFVADHVRLFATIEAQTATEGGVGPGARAVHPVQADVRALPLRTASLDVVMCTGSLSHFAQTDAVFAETARVLRPGGLLVMTEEAGLLGPGGEPSGTFRRLHPPDIFFLIGVEARVAQLRAAGFTDVVVRELTDWARALLHDRLKVMRLFFGDLAAIYGRDEARTLLDTLTAARDEYRRGSIVPALVTARLPV